MLDSRFHGNDTLPRIVIPAKAGIHYYCEWTPAPPIRSRTIFTGMAIRGRISTVFFLVLLSTGNRNVTLFDNIFNMCYLLKSYFNKACLIVERAKKRGGVHE